MNEFQIILDYRVGMLSSKQNKTEKFNVFPRTDTSLFKLCFVYCDIVTVDFVFCTMQVNLSLDSYD